MKRYLYLLTVFVILSVSVNVFGVERVNDDKLVNTAFVKSTELVDEKKDVVLMDDLNEYNTENENDIIVDYRTAIEEIVKTLNEKDSYFYEIVNPTDYIKYVKGLNIILPDDLSQYITHIDFVKLLNEITEKISDKPYKSDLVNITNVFEDLEGLSNEDLEGIKIVYIQGLLSGAFDTNFNPKHYLTKGELSIILNNLRNGYSRQDLFDFVGSGFTDEERESVLDGVEDEDLKYGKMVNFLFMLTKNPVFNSAREEELVTIREFLEQYCLYTDNKILLYVKETDSFVYPGKDTFILSDEEWEYLSNNLNKIMKYSEAKLLTERTKLALEEIKSARCLDKWEEIDVITQKYLPFTYRIVSDYKDCMTYFLDLNKNVRTLDSKDYSRAVHEAQHEGSARLSKTFQGRRKGADFWEVRWNSKPSTFYYYDFTNDTWVDSKSMSLPNTKIIYSKRISDGMKEDTFLKDYSTKSDFISNIYGLQGLLQEFCSYALECKVEFASYSLGLNSASIWSTNYDWYLIMKYMVVESLNYIEENNKSAYTTFMADTDMIRMLNNIFEEIDWYESVYSTELSKHESLFPTDLVKWGYNLGVPISFLENPLEISENDMLS